MWVVHCHTCKKDLFPDITHKKTADSLKRKHIANMPGHIVSVYREGL